jgi:hypothetical protein
VSTDGPCWLQAVSVERRYPPGLRHRDIPKAPGVYIWFRDNKPVYAGRAVGAGGLQERLGKHLATGLDLSRSTLRATIASQTLGIERSAARSRPTTMTAEQIAVVNDWLTGCELGWIECPTVEEAVALEDKLLREWRPPLNLR